MTHRGGSPLAPPALFVFFSHHQMHRLDPLDLGCFQKSLLLLDHLHPLAVPNFEHTPCITHFCGNALHYPLAVKTLTILSCLLDTCHATCLDTQHAKPTLQSPLHRHLLFRLPKTTPAPPAWPPAVAGWQNLAAFRREQKWQCKFSSSAYLQFSRQLRLFCA